MGITLPDASGKENNLGEILANNQDKFNPENGKGLILIQFHPPEEESVDIKFSFATNLKDDETLLYILMMLCNRINKDLNLIKSN